MESQQSMYPKIIDSNPPDFNSPSPSKPSIYPSLHDQNPNPTPSSSPSSLYPSIDMKDLVENLFPDAADDDPTTPQLPPPVEETLLTIPGAILHLIDRHNSVQLGSGDFTIARIRQADSVVAVVARLADIQWPLARDEAAVKLDDSHYFFALHDPSDSGLLNYGLTFAAKGQCSSLRQLDEILQSCSSFSLHKVGGARKGEILDLDGLAEREVSPADLMGSNKGMIEERSAAYWTTLAPNVEDYSSSVAKVIAKGTGKLIQGILWCGDVTVDRLKWGEDLLKRRMDPNGTPSEVSKDALKRIKRVKRVTKMSENVVTGILSGVVKVSGFFTSSVVNSKVGRKFFGLLPGEVVLASLDGFAKICDAAEMAGKNVLQTSSVVTTGLVSHRYGEQAAEVTHEGLGAAGHAIGTAWTVFKIRKAFNPKSAIKPTTLAKSAAKAAAADLKAKQGKK